ncbi:MAG: glutamine amidotransferase, partial [Serratia liquefaciens]|nr:glutamine amidotransferase [Serratia liquefaciens]
MKKVVAIRHVNFENLGILGSLLSLRGYQIDYYDAGRDDIRTINNDETDLLVVLGGPISAAQHFAGQQHYAFLNDELALVTQRLQQKRPTIGVCLGAQVIAQALGAEVVSLGVKEIGYAPLALTG